MDRQSRITKWDEWEVGTHYEWTKGGTSLGDYVLIEKNEKEGYVVMQIPGSSFTVKSFNWQRRYRKRVG